MDTPLLALTRPRSGLAGRSPTDAAAENMRQLIQLRWLAVVGQLVAILLTHFGLGVRLPLGPMLAVVAVLALANLLFTLTSRRPRLLLALLLDMAALTGQLYLSGGATNPFISLYLLQVVLGAILLGPAAVWLLVAASSMCVAFLSLAHLPLEVPAFLPQAELILAGEWVSFFMVATLLVLFITRISRNLRARDSYVAELGQRAAEEDGIVRMGLFASGAAHELGTPLSSLSVLVADWQRHPTIAADPELMEELADAQGELQRCKEIVSDILHSAGQSRGEAMGSTAAEDVLEEIVSAWRSLHSEVSLEYRPEAAAGAKVAAEPALRQAIWSLLENAAEASPRSVTLASETEGDRLLISILDDGPGFPDEILAGIGQLYRSSKGAGHGLGLFLAGNVARRLGGTLDVANRVEGGAVARLSLPLVSRLEEGE